MNVAAQAPATPFKGLAPFQDTELDALLFYGREREREVVVANLLASRLTVLYGASGVGKTSLLRAAVAHSLRQVHDAAVIVFSSWAGDPQAGLAAAIDEAIGIETSGTLSERLRAASEAVAGDVYLLLDQFEEYFLYHERDEFADELAAAIREPGLRANFLLGLREDALAKLDAFKGQIPNLFANYLRLDHLDRHGARAAIIGPVERYNELTGQDVQVEPELVGAVLDQVAAGKVDVGRAGRGGVETDEERIEAPYLQLVLERLWEVERERGSSVLRLATLRELGGAESIVRAHLERALAALQPAEQDVAATMFDHLVTPSGSKIAHRPGDLAQYAAVTEADVTPVLNALGRERIVRAVDGAGGDERYEIFHDVLADGVLAWRARRELERDRERARTHQRRLVIVAALALLGLAAMTAVAVYALTERSHARSAAREARASALEATALGELPGNPQRALADAVAGARSSPSDLAAELLRQALLQARLRRILPAQGPVSVVSFAPRGRRMLAAGADPRVRIYSAGGKLERTLSVGTPVSAASFSPNGKLLVAAGGRQASVWSVSRGTRLRTLHLPGSATSAMFSPNGRLLLTTSSAGGSTVWRSATGRRLAALEQGPVLAGTFSPDGRLVATVDASKPYRARVFAASSGRLLHVLAPGAELKGVAFSPNGRLLATTSYRGTYLWNPRTGRRIGRPFADRPPGPAALVTDAEFSPNSALLAVAGQDGAARVWDVKSGERRFYLPGHTNPVLAVAWSRDGRFVADASRDRTVHVWSVEGPESGQRVGNLLGHGDAVTAIAWSRDGSSILSGSDDRTARLWDVRFGQELHVIGTHHGTVVTASFDPRGRRVVSAGADGTARIWDVRGRRLLQLLRHERPVNDAEFSPNGRLVVTASADRTAGVWDSTTGARLRTLHADAPVLVARFSLDGAIVMTGDARGDVQLWRTRGGRLLATERQRGRVVDAAFAPDGGALYTAGHDGASVWSIPSGRRVRVLRSPGGVLRVAFSPAGSLVAAAGEDGAARIWDVRSGRRTGVFRVSKQPLRDVVFSPDGRLLLTTGFPPRSVTTWDVRTGKLLHALVGHTGRVVAGVFSPNGRWIATAGPTTVGLWQRNGDRPYFYLRSNETRPDEHLTAVSFSPNGRLVLSSSEDGSVRLYKCEVCGGLPALLKLATARLLALRG
jgi:WD40 repeat protein